MHKKSFTLTENDCQEILSTYYNDGSKFEINNFAVEPVSNSFGLLGEHYILKLTSSNRTGRNDDLSFYLKTLKRDSEIINKFIESGNLFEKEVCCYKFFEKLRTENASIDLSFCAKYYYSRKNEFLVLENLYESGYKVIDVAHLDVKHMKVALAAIAKFHASSLIFEEITSKKSNRCYSLTEDYSEYLQEALFKDDKNYVGYKYVQSGLQALNALIDQLPCKLPPNDLKQKVSALAVRAYEEARPSNTFKNVLSHADLWIKNAMFLYKNGEPVSCKIFDFQFLRYAPPARDVLEFIYDSADKNVHQYHLDVLLMHYYKCMENELKRLDLSLEDIFSYDEFYSSAKKLIPVAKLTKAIHNSVTTTSHYGIFYGDPSQEVVEAFKTQEAYSTRMTSLIEELEDLIIQSD